MTPEENVDRQAARAEKREQAKDARLVAQLAVQIWAAERTTSHPMDAAGATALARTFLWLARETA